MKAGYMGPMALVLALVLGGCGDDDSASTNKPDPFGNAASGGGSTSSSGVNKGVAGTGGTTGSSVGTTAGTAGTSAGIAGTNAGPPMPGAMNDGGMMMMKPPMMEGMKPPPMEGMMPGMMEEMPALVCPATAPVNDTPCTAGRGMCTFGSLKCRCKKEGWSCETAPVMTPPADGGMPMP